jgi:aryl-alcohol dehydrogenase-like predicted oxidoreductase
MLTAMSSALVLGGHSFIRQLGTDAEPSREEAARIVAACLDQGITRFDTTYLPERVRLGQALSDLDRHDEAEVSAWNFFEEEHADGSLGGPAEWTQERFDLACEQCQRDIIDLLVVHPVPDPAAQARQEALAVDWLDQGLVSALAAWSPNRQRVSISPTPYSILVHPCNPAQGSQLGIFPLAKIHGWETWGCSPFVRGYDLDRAVEKSGEDRAQLASDLLRFARHQPSVDALIVSMRHHSLVAANREAEDLGPLPVERRQELEALLKPE